MFAIEYTSNRPAGSAPYYSIVIREEPYMVGCLPINDVCLPCHDVSPQHATLEVMRQRQAVRTARDEDNDEVRSEHEEVDLALQDPAYIPRPMPAAAARTDDGAGGEGQPESEKEEMSAAGDVIPRENPVNAGGQQQPDGPLPLFEEDPLVVRLTALPTKGEGSIIVDGRELAPGESVILQNGSEVHLCSEASVVFRFRPLVVSIESTAFTKDYTRDLVYMFRRLGATLCNVVSGPTPDLANIPTPIGLLHCVEELNDSNGCVVALACGYSVVQPTYVFEWFATLAQTPSQPLSVLPPPSRFEVPIRTTLHPRSTIYIRPESDTCPYSLYPIPSTAMRKRNRAELFFGRTFYFASHTSAEKYMSTLVQCGGAAYAVADTEAVKAVLNDMVETQPNVNLNLIDGAEEQPYPSGFYVIVDGPAEAAMLNDGLRSADPDLCQFMEDINALGATHVPILGDHSLFTSLLSNYFSYEPVQYSVDPPLVLPPVPAVSSSTGLIGYRAFTAVDGCLGGDDGNGDPVLSAGGIQRGPHQAAGPSSGSRRSSAAARRGNLLPHHRSRTPSRSEMRSASRQRQRSLSHAVSETCADSTRHYSRGRRHLVRTPRRSPARGAVAGADAQLSVGDRFDILRIRIYAFLVREEPKLDSALTTFQRSYFVDDAVAERALETKAQAEDYMEQVDQLLDEGGYGPYTDSLRRFWRDSSDLAVKADKVLAAFAKQARSRRPNSRRASSTYGSRTGSLSREGNEIFEGSVNLDGSITNNNIDTEAVQERATTHDAAAAALSPRSGAGATSPRIGARSASVREHRDAYLSLGGQRMSLSASQNKSQAQGAGGTANGGSNNNNNNNLQSSTHSHSSQRVAESRGAAANVSPRANSGMPEQQQQQQHIDPTPAAVAPAPAPAPARAHHHHAVQSDIQRRRQQAANSPSMVRSSSRNGVRRPNSKLNGSSSFQKPADASVISGSNGGSVLQARQGGAEVHRTPPPKPYRERERGTNARKAPQKERPAWQS